MKSPKTTNEHIIALYGYITGLRRDINSIKNNHLKHMHKDIDELHNKVDRLLYWILGGLGATIATLVGLIK
jgi:L-lactate utilization protein LutB